MMLFPAVLMNFPNSEVCLIGEWSISEDCGGGESGKLGNEIITLYQVSLIHG